MATIYEMNGLSIKEEDSSYIVLTISKILNDTYNKYFTAIQGQILETNESNVLWKFGKNANTSQVINSMIPNFNLESLYKINQFQPPMNQFQPPSLSNSTSSNQTPPPSENPFPFQPPQSSNPFQPPQSSNPFQPPQSSNPFQPPQSSNPFQPPQSSNPFQPPQNLPGPGMFSNMNSSSSQSYDPNQQYPQQYPQKVHEPKKLIYKSQPPNPEVFVYDYSPASIAVFLGKDAYATIEPILKQLSQGKPSNKLYPDGGQIYRFGWVFAKSNEQAISYLTQFLQFDIKANSDYSQVRSYNKGGGYGQQQYPQQQYSGMPPQQQYSGMPPKQQQQYPQQQQQFPSLPGQQPQIVTGPFLPSNPSLPSGFKLPGVPDNGVVEQPLMDGVIDIMNRLNKNQTLETKIDGDKTYYIGNINEVNEKIMSKNIIWKIEIGNNMAVCI